MAMDAITYGALLAKWMEALETLGIELSGGKSMSKLKITKVIFNEPATIVFWSDETKTVVKCCSDEKFDKEKGLAMAVSKKMFGNKGGYYDIFKAWIKEA